MLSEAAKFQRNFTLRYEYDSAPSRVCKLFSKFVVHVNIRLFGVRPCAVDEKRGFWKLWFPRTRIEPSIEGPEYGDKHLVITEGRRAAV